MSLLKNSKIILKMKAKIIFQKNKVDDVIYHFNFNMYVLNSYFVVVKRNDIKNHAQYQNETNSSETKQIL